jgi:myo-inositol-1(or 4)-monophosphatase
MVLDTARPSAQDLEFMLHEVQSLSREAGTIAMGYFEASTPLAVESKGYLDLVTEADRDVERFVVDRLRTLFPDDGIVGEEGAQAESRSGRTWVIDPIDGTMNFVRGSDQWSVSIGLFDGRRPSFGVVNIPAQGKLIAGGDGVAPRINGQALSRLAPIDRSRAVVALGLGPASAEPNSAELVDFVGRQAGMLFRYSGCGSVSLMSVALGEVDGYISLGESSWDVVAALAILAELGAHSTVDWQAQGLAGKFPMSCGTPEFLSVASQFRPKGQT